MMMNWWYIIFCNTRTDVAGEVSAAVRQALEAKYQGKNDKAHKLFQHALALDPNHADALNEYGEFIEKEDIVRANYLYSHAVVVNGTHPKALTNRWSKTFLGY